MKCFFEIRWHVTNLTKNTVVATQEQEQQLPERKPKRKYFLQEICFHKMWPIFHMTDSFWWLFSCLHIKPWFFTVFIFCWFVNSKIIQTSYQILFDIIYKSSPWTTFQFHKQIVEQIKFQFFYEKNTFDKLLLIWTRNFWWLSCCWK